MEYPLLVAADSGGPVGLRVMAAQSALNTEYVIGIIDGRQMRELAVYVVFGTGCSAGAVVVEESPVADYTGTWANLATVNWAAASRVHAVHVTGVHLATRIRISTAIVGGTIDVYVIAN